MTTYANRICVELQLRCGECDRTDRVTARMTARRPGELVLLGDAVPVPEGWTRAQVDGATWELFCPAHHREVRL